MKKITIVSKAPLNSLQVKPQTGQASGDEFIKNQESGNDRTNQIQVQAQIEAAYRQGYQEGNTATKQQIAQIEDRLQQLSMQANQSYQQWQHEVGSEITVLLGQIVERLLLYYRREGDYAIEKIVAKAVADLQGISGCSLLEIRCSPQDLKVLQQSSLDQNLRISADAQIAGGDCILRTNLGTAVVELQDRIEQLLRLLPEAE